MPYPAAGVRKKYRKAMLYDRESYYHTYGAAESAGPDSFEE